MDYGLSNILGANALTNLYRLGGASAKNSGISFMDLATATAASSAATAQNVTGVSFKEMCQARFPGAYYHVMDASNIPQSLWERNDFPFEKFFADDVDESVLNWTPAGAEPAMDSSQVQARFNSILGQTSIVVPPELEEKMKNDPSLANKVRGCGHLLGPKSLSNAISNQRKSLNLPASTSIFNVGTNASFSTMEMLAVVSM